MSLKCGIIGLPNVGKSTLFNALSQAKAVSANYPFCTIEPNIGVAQLADPRLTQIADLIKPQKIIPTTMQFVDIAGLVKGASQGEGLGNQFLSHIREVDALTHIIRCFEDSDIIHVANEVNPIADKEIIDTELQIKDMEVLEKRMTKIAKQAKTGDKKLRVEWEWLKELHSFLSQGKNIRDRKVQSEEEQTVLNELCLITAKPIIYLANIDEKSLTNGNVHTENLKKHLHEEQGLFLTICASLECQIAELDLEEKGFFMEEYGLKESALDRFVQSSYSLLNLITFFTAGEKEVRAWTISKGTKAPQAAGVIHTDFERGFIRVEVIKIKDLETLGSELACKNAGKVAIEGKDYIVEDGDVVHFRFNI